MLTGLVNNTYDTIRTLVIGGKYSKSDLAYYDRGLTYSKYTVQVSHSMISSVVLPILARKQDSIDDIKRVSRKIVGLTGFIMFPVLFGVAAVSRPLILVLLTEKWASTIPFLMVFCFMRVPGVIAVIDRQMFYSIGRSDIILKYAIISLVLNIVSLIIVLPYGVFAIAINTLVIEFVICIIIMVLASVIMKYRVGEKVKDLWKQFMSSAIMFLFVYAFDSLIKYNLLLQLFTEVLMGSIVYLICILITRDKNIYVVKKLIENKFRRPIDK